MNGEQTICALCRVQLQGVPVDRFFCTQRCASRAARYLAERKTCSCCGEVFVRDSQVSRDSFARVRFCSHRCRGRKARADRVAALGLKTCPGCEQEFAPRPGERRFDFQARRFCTVRCANRSRDRFRPRAIWAEAIGC